MRKQSTNTEEKFCQILTTALETVADTYLKGLRDNIEGISFISQYDIIDGLQPRGEFITRDTVVLGQGMKVPPHIEISSEALAIEQAVQTVVDLGRLARQAGSHIARKRKKDQRAKMTGTNVFLGHGRSLIWRELKDFVEERIKLPTDEFNRVPVAGVTNIARLSEMLDFAVIAFLIMTGEDEQQGGQLHARMNVVHEAGLFQGRLGFNRAIVVLEEGCEAFSNIEGLGQIRFPKNNIKAAFEEIRQVLEREGLVAG